jgi:hypothetical protein
MLYGEPSGKAPTANDNTSDPLTSTVPARTEPSGSVTANVTLLIAECATSPSKSANVVI